MSELLLYLIGRKFSDWRYALRILRVLKRNLVDEVRPGGVYFECRGRLFHRNFFKRDFKEMMVKHLKSATLFYPVGFRAIRWAEQRYDHMWDMLVANLNYYRDNLVDTPYPDLYLTIIEALQELREEGLG